MRAGTQKQVRTVLRYAELKGWDISDTKKGWMLRSPDGVTSYTVHVTLSDWRATRNAMAFIERHSPPE